MSSPEEPQDNQGASDEQTKQRKERTPKAYPLPSNRHPFAVHFEVIRRFVTLGKNGEGIPASRVEGNGVPAQVGSLNVRFLRSVGMLTVTGRGLYAPTDLARRFVMAKSISDEKARPILAEALSGTWFADAAQSAFRTKPVMTEEDTIGELAWAAQTDKLKEGPALRVLLEYLGYSGLVTRDERGLSWGSGTIPAAVLGAEVQAAGPLTSSIPTVERVAGEVPGWHILSTEDFYVKVKSDIDVVQDLIEHLEPIRKKIQRLRAKAVSTAASPPPAEQQAVD